MKTGKLLALFGILLFSTNCWSQVSVSLNPSGISPSSYNVYTHTAGDKLVDPVDNYTSQTVKYSWPFLSESVVGSIDVSATGIPAGIKMTILATGSAGLGGGSSTGTITLSTTPTSIISGIWYASNKSRGLTQDVFIDNFALLKAGNKTITVTYTIN